MCINASLHISRVKMRIGDLNLDDSRWDGANPIEGVVDEIKVHPEYKVDSLAKDIALIRLKEPIPDTCK